MEEITNYPQTAQGQAVPADAIDIAHDRNGIAYPNLHRRIDNEIPLPEDPEERQGRLAPDTYDITVAAVNSFMNDTDFQDQMTFDDFQIPGQISIDDLLPE